MQIKKERRQKMCKYAWLISVLVIKLYSLIKTWDITNILKVKLFWSLELLSLTPGKTHIYHFVNFCDPWWGSVEQQNAIYDKEMSSIIVSKIFLGLRINHKWNFHHKKYHQISYVFSLLLITTFSRIYTILKWAILCETTHFIYNFFLKAVGIFSQKWLV